MEDRSEQSQPIPPTNGGGSGNPLPPGNFTESVEKYLAFFDAADEGIAIMPIDGSSLSVNAAFARMHGYSSPGEMKHLRLEDIDTPGAGELAADRLSRIRSGEALKFDVEHYRRDGGTIILNVSCKVVNIMGKPYFLGLHRDMTERTLMEKRLNEALDLLEATNRLARIGGWGKDLITGADEWSAVTREIHEVGPDFVPNVENSLKFYKEGPSRERITRAVERCIREGEPYDIEVEFVTAKGRELWIRTLGQAEFKDGRCVRIFGAFQDVTDLKLAQEALRRSEEKYRKLIETTGTGFAILDSRGLVADANAEYLRLTGRRELAEILGRSPLEWAAPQDARRCAGEIDRCLRGAQVMGFQADFIGPDGNAIPVEISAMSDGAGDSIRIFALCRDITWRRRAEESMRRVRTLESLGATAGGIAHDFNNLLMGVFGNLELARIDLPPGHPSQAALAAADQALENARGLTSRLLTFARGGNPILETLDLRLRIRSTVQFHLAGSLVAPEFDVPEDLWAVKADASQLSEVLSNLTVNAREAMPAGGALRVKARNVNVALECAGPEPPDPFVEVSFSDDGVGIPSNIAGRIFDPYFTTKKAGSGLGLAIVHGIVTRHGGQVSVESKPGQGSTFTVLLPAAGTPLPKSGEAAGPLAALRFSARVLVMDDEEMVRGTLARMLENFGCSVETAADGKEALAKYSAARERGSPFDIAIMDLTVPGGMGGKEAIGKLLDIDPSAKAIVSSGYSSDPVLADFAAHGFSWRLVKPFGLQELEEALSRLLR